MGWIVLNASLSVSDTKMVCDDGTVTATVTITGSTDEGAEINTYTAYIKDDYVIADVLWQSEPQTFGASQQVERSHTVELSCNAKYHVVGPHGSSGERVAELYAYVIGGGREGASNEVKVSCLR